MAVTTLLPLIVMVAGFADPVRLPLQPVKTQPEAGVAFNWTLDPWVYVAWFGFLETEPWPETDTVREYRFHENAADTVPGLARRDPINRMNRKDIRYGFPDTIMELTLFKVSINVS
jgi:hypothetical protein